MRKIYIWQQDGWPLFTFDKVQLITPLSRLRAKQGELLGMMKTLGFEVQGRTQLETLTNELVKSSEIEGAFLNVNSVRSSIARHLGISLPNPSVTDYHIDGLVQVMFDATVNNVQPLTAERLFGWHAALFPNGYSGMYPITVANWRQGDEPMQVISGAMGKEKVHYEAPPSVSVAHEMEQFFSWFNAEDKTLDPVLKAGIAHLWFVSIHPFDDGNGRLTRTLTDMLLSRADGVTQRYYTLSAEINRDKNEYYNQLENAQHGGVDITLWLLWFIQCVGNAVSLATETVNKTLNKSKFWDNNRNVSMNERQIKVINMLWDGFEGNLTVEKWAKIGKCSQDTASRDIKYLVENNILKSENPNAKRNVKYILCCQETDF